MEASQLDQLLKFLLETLQQGKDFTLEQAPQFVRELLVWRFYEAVFFCGLGVVFVVIGAVIALLMKRAIKAGADDMEGAQWIPGLVGLVLGGLLIGINLHTAIQVKVAPRVVLVEMVRDMLVRR